MNTLKKRVNQRGQGGFTLIELLVVIAILAILAGVVVFAVGNSTANAELSACKTEAASLETAAVAAKTANLVNIPTAQEDIWDYLDKADLIAVNASTSYFNVASDLSAPASPPAGATFTRKNKAAGTLMPDCKSPATVLP